MENRNMPLLLMYGECKFGENCSFAHGDSELKQRKLTFNYKTKPCK